jgi:hypothetical protein
MTPMSLFLISALSQTVLYCTTLNTSTDAEFINNPYSHLCVGSQWSTSQAEFKVLVFVVFMHNYYSRPYRRLYRGLLIIL